MSQKDLLEAVDLLCESMDVTQEDGRPMATDSYGKTYVTFVVGGVKEEGAEFPLYATSAYSAIEFYLHFLRLHLENKKLVIWRGRPVLYNDGHRGEKWQVHSRLTAYRANEKLS